MSKQCPRCQEELVYKEGFSKEKNKPWKGYFCNRQCGFVEWLKVQPQQTFDKMKYQTQPSEIDVLSEQINNVHEIVKVIYKMEFALYKHFLTKNNGGKTNGTEGGAVAESGKGDNVQGF